MMAWLYKVIFGKCWHDWKYGEAEEYALTYYMIKSRCKKCGESRIQIKDC